MMTPLRFLRIAMPVAMPLAVLFACSSESRPPDNVNADHPPLPKIESAGGPVFKNPILVPITYDEDPMRSSIEEFATAIGATAYWQSTAGEYGIGAAKIGVPIHLKEPAPDAITESELNAKLASEIAKLGSPDPQTVFSFFFPARTAINAAVGKSCETFGGYHSELEVGAQHYAYAVVARCPPSAPQTEIDRLTATASHEWIEAATNPFPASNPAFAIADKDHLVWAEYPSTEIVDMCSLLSTRDATPSGFPHAVSKVWSNLAASQGKDPCIPAPDLPYFNSVPVLDDDVDYVFRDGKIYRVKGVRIPVGSEKAIDVKLFSSGSLEPWSVAAMDLASWTGKPEALAFRWDRTTGKSGEKLRLTIHATRETEKQGAVFVILSRSGTRTHSWTGYVSTF